MLLFPNHVILKTTPPGDLAIALTQFQLADLEQAYLHGFDNPEPNDPYRRLQMLLYKRQSA